MARGAAINTYGTYYKTLRAEEARSNGATVEDSLLQTLRRSEDAVTFNALQEGFDVSPLDLADMLRHLSQVGLVRTSEAPGGDQAFRLTPDGEDLARRRAA